jgi:hypothetical protein
MCGRGLLRGWWWSVGPKLVFDKMQAIVPEIIDTSNPVKSYLRVLLWNQQTKPSESSKRIYCDGYTTAWIQIFIHLHIVHNEHIAVLLLWYRLLLCGQKIASLMQWVRSITESLQTVPCLVRQCSALWNGATSLFIVTKSKLQSFLEAVLSSVEWRYVTVCCNKV